MIAIKTGMRILLAALALTPALAQSQASLMGDSQRSTSRPAAVAYLYPEQLTLPAGKPAIVALHFRILPGLHINSHTPRQQELISTTLTIPEASGVRLDEAIYPSGVEFTLPLDPQTRLSVYTGDFAIQARIVAVPGEHLVEARLRYQACDNSACMPPKTITAAIDVIGK
jgi:hypothetical protein